MALLVLVFIAVNCGVVFSEGPTHGKKVVCYMHNWANYRKDLGQFNIEDIEPSLCTNIVYSFAVLEDSNNTIRSGDKWQDLETDYGKAGYRRVNALKENYPHLKVSISLGGWADGSAKYSAMAATPATRQTFIQSVLDFLKLHNFDGLDMHWKFPTLRDGKPYDKANYVLLLKELKEAFTPHNYLLTAAFGAGKSTMEAAYDLAKLNRHLDYLHLLSFDYHGAWDGSVGSNAPLRGTGQNDLNSLEFSVNYMINNGVSPGKIVLGLPAFGRTFELLDPAVKSIEFARTRTKPVGFQGPYTVENGLMGYNEICMETSNTSSHWSHHWDDRSATAYIRDRERVVCYDSGRSIAIKVKMAVDRGLGGLMVWSLDTDDFRGLCDAEVGSYMDFQTRFSELANNPALTRVIRSLNLPASDKAAPTDYYVTKNGQLSLRLPQRGEHTNYNILRTVNAAAALASQEKRILDALPAGDNNGASGGVSGFRSDYVYYQQAGYWFKEHRVPADWHTARLQCHYEGAVLASPLNRQIATVLKAIIDSFQAASPKTSLFFSGVHQTFGDGVYTSIEGVPLEKMSIGKWVKVSGDSRAQQQCLALWGAGVTPRGCGERLPYVCYRARCAADRLSACGTVDGAYEQDASGRCHKLHAAGGRWARALAACGAEGGRLAVARGAGEARALAALAGPRAALLGLRRWGAAWWTVAGTPLSGSGFSEWCPDCDHSGLDCGALSNGQLAAVSCDAVQPFLCERETDVLTNATGAACPSTNDFPFLTC